MSARITAVEYAEKVGKHPDTIQRMCREGKLHARRIGLGPWEIDFEKSEEKLSLAYGNSVEQAEIKSRRKRFAA